MEVEYVSSLRKRNKLKYQGFLYLHKSEQFSIINQTARTYWKSDQYKSLHCSGSYNCR